MKLFATTVAMAFALVARHQNCISISSSRSKIARWLTYTNAKISCVLTLIQLPANVYGSIEGISRSILKNRRKIYFNQYNKHHAHPPHQKQVHQRRSNTYQTRLCNNHSGKRVSSRQWFLFFQRFFFIQNPDRCVWYQGMDQGLLWRLGWIRNHPFPHY